MATPNQYSYHNDVAHLQPPTNIPTKYQLLHLMVSEIYSPNKIFLVKVTISMSKVIYLNKTSTAFKDIYLNNTSTALKDGGVKIDPLSFMHEKIFSHAYRRKCEAIMKFPAIFYKYIIQQYFTVTSPTVFLQY